MFRIRLPAVMLLCTIGHSASIQAQSTEVLGTKRDSHPTVSAHQDGSSGDQGAALSDNDADARQIDTAPVHAQPPAARQSKSEPDSETPRAAGRMKSRRAGSLRDASSAQNSSKVGNVPPNPFDSVPRPTDEDQSDPPPPLEFFPLSPKVTTKIIHTGPEGTITASIFDSSDEKLVYSNKLGRFVFPLFANQIMADDLTTLTPGGCALRRYSFQIVGKANPRQVGGSYFIEYGLYDNCPQAIGFDPAPIPGTRGTLVVFDDSQVIEVNFAPAPGKTVTIPSTVWLGIKPSRANIGLVGGAPARVGFSQDGFAFPGSSCNASYGGFPKGPHASLNAQVFVDNTCDDAYPGYQNLQPFQSAFSPGSRACFADDLQLNVPDCVLTAYEVGVRLGHHTSASSFRLRFFRDDDGLPGAEIPGTFKAIAISTGEGSYRLHVPLTDSIALNTDRVWLAAEIGAPGAGWIYTRRASAIGGTSNGYVRSASGRRCSTMVTNPDWQFVAPPSGGEFGAGFDVTLYCAGDPPIGACCDMYLTDDGVCDTESKQCVGGEFDSDVCYADIDCKGEPTCLNLPEMNCPFPPRNSNFSPKWQAGTFCRECNGNHDRGQLCESDADCNDSYCVDTFPFGEFTPCGVAACCDPGNDECRNMTEKECARVPPAYGADSAHRWQLGRYCGVDFQQCPLWACVHSQEPCTEAHSSSCVGGPFADQECNIAEDCVWPCGLACSGTEGEQLCKDDSDCEPGSGCRLRCLGGPFVGDLCTDWDDCFPSGTCVWREPFICAQGINDGQFCEENRDCPLGGCSEMECQGGPRNGLDCERDFDCRAGICLGQPGCRNPWCCSEVCENDPSPLGASCCSSNWTAECAALALKNAEEGNCFLRLDPSNDECEYAEELFIGKTSLVDISQPGTIRPDESLLCCSNDLIDRRARPARWNTFVATAPSVRINACRVDDSEADALLQVFSVENNVSPYRACETLQSIACNDDSPQCGGPGDASVCVTDLKIGATYYVLLATKPNTSPGLFELTLEAGCDVPNRGCDERSAEKESSRTPTR